MNYKFKAFGGVAWELTDSGILFKNSIYRLEELLDVKLFANTNSSLINGVIQITVPNGSILNLAFPYSQKSEAMDALEYMKENFGSVERKQKAALQKEKDSIGLIYDLKGVRGRSLKVYEDRCIITVKAGIGSFITGNISDGEKTIYYSDCIGVQFKESGVQIGYLQLETASLQMNNSADNFFNENSFTFDTTVQSNDTMKQVANYVREQVAEAKKAKNHPAVQVQQVSAADEIKKFKDLLDMGVITEVEFNEKKKQLLGL